MYNKEKIRSYVDCLIENENNLKLSELRLEYRNYLKSISITEFAEELYYAECRKNYSECLKLFECRVSHALFSELGKNKDKYLDWAERELSFI